MAQKTTISKPLSCRPQGFMSASFRDEARAEDVLAVREIVASTGFFSREEEDIAAELVTERLSRGAASGYHFVFAEFDGGTGGYACYGPIPATKSSFALYWIAVRKELRSNGLGGLLMEKTEEAVRRAGGDRLYAETSSRAQYEPTRAFYRKRGFVEEAFQEDFYAPGDGKVIFRKLVK